MLILTLLFWAGTVAAKPPVAAWEPPGAMADDYNRAVELLNGGNPGKAEEIAARLVAKAPDCGMLLTLLGQARSRQNRPEQALEPLQHAVALFPERALAQVLLAEAAFGAQDFALASEASGRALTLEPTDLGHATFAIQASLRLGDVAEARARLERARVRAPDRACLDVGILLEAGDLAAAKARFAACDDTADPRVRTNARAMIGGYTDDRATVAETAAAMGVSGFELAERGRALVDAGRCAEAIPVFEAAMVGAPRDLNVRVNHAVCLVQQGRLEEAERALVAVVGSDTWVDLHVSGAMSGITTKSAEQDLHLLQREAALLLVDVQTRRARTKEAAESLAAARARYGEVVEIVIAQAALVTAQGSPGEGWRLLREAMARFPAQRPLAVALVRHAVDDPSGLDASIVAYVRAYGEPVDRYNLGLAEFDAKDWAGCLEDLGSVFATQPDVAQDAYHCAVQAGELDRAFTFLGPLGDAAPRPSVFNHALSLRNAQRPADALSLLRLYPAQDPEMERSMRQLAVDSHVALGQLGEAVPLVAKGGLDPRFSAWVGQELLRAGRKNDAARVLGGVCPQLSGKDAEICQQMLQAAAK